jgi:phage protein D
VTTVLDARLMSLTLTDNRGFEADQLDLELDDADGQIVLPRRGALFSWRWGGKASRFSQRGIYCG